MACKIVEKVFRKYIYSDLEYSFITELISARHSYMSLLHGLFSFPFVRFHLHLMRDLETGSFAFLIPEKKKKKQERSGIIFSKIKLLPLSSPLYFYHPIIDFAIFIIFFSPPCPPQFPVVSMHA